MNSNFSIHDRVHRYYWDHDTNCATVTLLNIAGYFGKEIGQQVIDAAAGLHGAGRFGAQCGLVEGTLMYIGIRGRELKLEEQEIEQVCREFASLFIERFGDLRCSVLRPGGFRDDDPPHRCEELTVKANIFSIEYISNSEMLR